jgi:hypothetical protein
VFRNQQTRTERANGRPKLQACGNHGVGQPPVFRWNVLRNQFGGAGKCNRLSYAEEQPERQQRGETSREAGRDGSQRPYQETGSQNPVRAKVVYYPSDHKLQGHVCVKESGKQKAELGGGKPELSLDDRRGDGKISAIHVIDDNRQPEKNQRRREGWLPRALGFRRRSGKHCADYLVS